MATSKTSAPCTKIPRFSSNSNLRTFHVDVLQDCGYLAVSGYNIKEMVTFIDLFKISDIDHDEDKPLLENSRPFSSIEHPSAGSDNCCTTCFLDNTYFLSCSMNIIQKYLTETGSVEKEITFDGKPRCMVKSGKTVYIALSSSQVAMFDVKLRLEKTIKLIGIYFPNWPLDIAVYQRRLFVCSNMGAVRMYNIDGGIQKRYRQANVAYNVPLSVTVSEKHGLLYVLWSVGYSLGIITSNCPRLVAVYSPDEGHFRAVFGVAIDSYKIKICDKDDRLFVVTSRSGDVYAYNVSDLFSFDNTLSSLEFVLEGHDCRQLARYFSIPPNQTDAIFNSDSASRSLLEYLRDNRKIAEDDVTSFTTACCHEGIIKAAEVLIHYQHFHYHRVKSKLESLTDAEEESE